MVNKAIFLCDSNGKFLDKRKLFSSGQHFKFFRCPKIEHVRTILQDEINQESEHPHLIVIHSGTNDLMHGSFLPVTIPSPGNPGDKSSPSVPGVGNCLKPSCPGGRGAGQFENNFLLFLCRYVTSRPSRLTPDRMEETAYFQGESLEFVADWLQKNNLSKLKSVFEGSFIMDC